MKRKLLFCIFLITLTVSVEGKKTSIWSRAGSSRGSSSSGSSSGGSKYWNVNKSHKPSSSSHASHQSHAEVQKPAFQGWQQKPAQSHQTPQLKPVTSQSHSYPSSNTGLSGNKPKQQPSHQDSVQRSNAPSNTAHQTTHTNHQPSHSYPSSTGLSGNSGNVQPQHGTSVNSGSGFQQHGTGMSGNAGHGYPQQHGTGLSGNSGSGYPPQQHGTGLSGSGIPQNAHPQQGSSISGMPAAPPPYSGYKSGQTYPNNNPNYYHPQGPPPPYTSHNYGGFSGGYAPAQVQQMPGYFGNYGNMGKGYGGMSRGSSALTGVGIAGAGIGTVLTGLALWNLARSTGQHHHTIIYDNRGQPVAVAPSNNSTSPVDPMLADLVNCSLSISNGISTEVLAIPCAIATSFSPEADVKDQSAKDIPTDNTTCTVTVLTKSTREFMTTIPCSILLKTAEENNVTETPTAVGDPMNVTNNSGPLNATTNLSENLTSAIEPTALPLTTDLNCTLQVEANRDPINPCYSLNHNLTVVPLQTTDKP